MSSVIIRVRERFDYLSGSHLVWIWFAVLCGEPFVVVVVVVVVVVAVAVVVIVVVVVVVVESSHFLKVSCMGLYEGEG